LGIHNEIHRRPIPHSNQPTQTLKLIFAHLNAWRGMEVRQCLNTS